VNDHVGNPIEFLANQESSGRGEVVRILNRRPRINFEMKFDVVWLTANSVVMAEGRAKCG
jgi:hypothetical protein